MSAETCAACGGSGRRDGETCVECGGSGVWHRRSAGIRRVPATPAPTPEPEAPTCTHCGGEGFLWKKTAGDMLQYRGKCVCSAPAVAPVPEDREEATKPLTGLLDAFHASTPDQHFATRLALVQFVAGIESRNRALEEENKRLRDAFAATDAALGRFADTLRGKPAADHGHTEGAT